MMPAHNPSPRQLTRRGFCAATLATMGRAALAAAPPVFPKRRRLRSGRAHRRHPHPRRRRELRQPAAAYHHQLPNARSPGGLHNYFSQADYFWPNPADPNGKSINRDGQSNPDNFNDHRKAMVGLSIQIPALTAAWRLTRNSRFGQHAADHLRAWFITPATRMNPHLEYSQGVHGVSTGRSYGIIDTLHLVEVARAASLLVPTMLNPNEQTALHAWFTQYLRWMKTSDKGIAESKTLNNHAVCWALQAAEFARLVGDQPTRREVRTQYKTLFVPN